MRTTACIVLSLVLTFCWTVKNSCTAQTIAIGHVTAEVIESISASSQAATTLSLGTTASGTSAQLTANSPTLNLGTMTVNSGSNATVNVVLKSATLSNSQGNGFTLDPSLNNNATASVTGSNGSQNIQLNGIANLGANQPSGLYAGSYTVVFAYN